MSYYNFEAAKRAYEAAPSLPSKQAGTAYKVYHDGAKPGTRMREKKEGPHMAAHILHVIATHSFLDGMESCPQNGSGLDDNWQSRLRNTIGQRNPKWKLQCCVHWIHRDCR